jgi:calcineurin-like phosphoesterase family protein
MDEYLINNTNECVGVDDTLFYLGDWVFPGQDNFAEVAKRYRNRINCKNIIFIWGNHDKKGRGNHQFTNLFRGCYDLLEIESNNQKITLCHYAMRTWNKSHHGAWHLYGHSHASLYDDPNSLSIDCGVDAAARYFSPDGILLRKEDFSPMSFAEIKQQMDKKVFKPIDHHGNS